VLTMLQATAQDYLIAKSSTWTSYWSGNVQIAAKSCLVIEVSHTYRWWDSWRSMYMSQSVCLTQSISRTLAKQHYIKFFGLQEYHMTPYIKPYCKAAPISFKCTCIGHVLVWVIKTIMNDQTPTVLWTIRIIVNYRLQPFILRYGKSSIVVQFILNVYLSLGFLKKACNFIHDKAYIKAIFTQSWSNKLISLKSRILIQSHRPSSGTPKITTQWCNTNHAVWHLLEPQTVIYSNVIHNLRLCFVQDKGYLYNSCTELSYFTETTYCKSYGKQ